MAGKKNPQRRTCGAMAVNYALLEMHPEFRRNQRILAEATLARRSAIQLPWKPITIPVVVHILYHTDKENISDDQIHSQIDVLNRDFRAQNPDIANTPSVWKGLAADAGIQFVLATVDPGGRPTKGINKIKTDRESFPYNVNESIKFAAQGGADAWPADKYLNIWVCTLEGGLLGYAQFPGGPALTDGVVILNSAFGTVGTAAAAGNHYNLGRTASHETGHYLNLRHIWGDEPDCAADDLVEDTPIQADANYENPQFPHISCNNGPNGDMFMNYMDYVYDSAMYMFTVGQVNRMHAALETMRSSFLK